MNGVTQATLPGSAAPGDLAAKAQKTALPGTEPEGRAAPRSMRAAINAKCRDCICDPLDKGTWRQQVEACRVEACSLWPYRPLSYSSKEPLQ